MKTIGDVRRLRLKQFIEQTGLTYAEMNGRLQRNRRDATLSQIAHAAKNTRTGKPRQMGDTQARLLEQTFGLPTGWFDRDPAHHPDVLRVQQDGRIAVALPELVPLMSWSPPAGTVAEEPVMRYDGSWPFARLKQETVRSLPAETKLALERLMLAFLGDAFTPPDWRSTAFRLAATLDKDHKTDTFTRFVRAIEVELSRPTADAQHPTEAHK